MKILQQDNFGSHYRAAIYQLMARELECDFCFGDKWDDIKKLDYSLLSRNVIEVRNIKIGSLFYYQKGILKLINKYDVFILIGDTRCISTWFFSIIARLFYPQKQIYFWTHGWYGKETKFEKALKKIFLRLPNGGCFLYGNYARKLMIEEGFSPVKLYVIHNSLDYDAQLRIRNSLKKSDIYQNHFGNTHKNIVFIGRLTKVKRFDLLIDAVALLKEKEQFVNITFVGDGVERHNIEEMVKRKGLNESVWFYGASYDEKSNAELLFNADLCVSPGNIGLTAMHVMMFGCPAITNDDFSHQMPEFEAIQEGKTGSFFKVGSSLSLAETISNWFSLNNMDREDVRQACYKEIDTGWNPHKQVQLIKDVLVSSYNVNNK